MSATLREEILDRVRLLYATEHSPPPFVPGVTRISYSGASDSLQARRSPLTRRIPRWTWCT